MEYTEFMWHCRWNFTVVRLPEAKEINRASQKHTRAHSTFLIKKLERTVTEDQTEASTWNLRHKLRNLYHTDGEELLTYISEQYKIARALTRNRPHYPSAMTLFADDVKTQLIEMQFSSVLYERLSQGSHSPGLSEVST